MYLSQAKKMLTMNILDILKKYTDENHRINQKDILEYLEKDYDMKVERKTVRNNIEKLIDEGHPIEYEEQKRSLKNSKTGEAEDNSIWKNFYYQHE